MIDRSPNLPRSGDSKAETPHADSDGDLLADSANGTVLDPDLEDILRKDRFLAFTDGKKMSQAAERLREEKPGEFDLAEQMAKAIRVSLDDYEDPEESWRSQERSERIFGVFDTMANLATPEDMERFLRNCMLKRLRNEWSGSLSALPKRYNYLGYSNSSEEKPGGPKKLKLLTEYVLGQVIEAGEEASLDPHRKETAKKPEGGRVYCIPSSQIRADSFIGIAIPKEPAKSSSLDDVEIDKITEASYSYSMGIPAAKERIANNPPDLESLSQLAGSSPGWYRRFGLPDNTYSQREELVRGFQDLQVGRLDRMKKALIVGKYPDWFSSYVISAYTELGEFDPQTERFNARESGSATLLPEVNTEALYRAYKEAARYYKSGKLESADFSELYGKEIAAVTSLGLGQRRETQLGEWHGIRVRRKKEQSDPNDDSSEQLHNLLAGQCTDWFPGDVESIKRYLRDNSVYFVDVLTTGKNNIPRIMMCTDERGSIQMILGIGENDQVEPATMGVLREEIGKLMRGQDKLDTMDVIDSIDKIFAKQQKGEELSIEEIRRLWFGFNPNGGESYFWRNGGAAKLRAIRSKRDFVEDVKTVVECSGFSAEHLAELILTHYVDQAEKLKGFFYDRGIFFTDDERYQKCYGKDPLDHYRNRCGYGVDSNCTDIVNRLIEDGRQAALFQRPGLFTEGLIKEMGGKFDSRRGVRVIDGSLDAEELHWTADIDFTELAKEAEAKKRLPGFIEFIARVKPPLGSFDINKFADDLLGTENSKVMSQLADWLDELEDVGLKSDFRGLAAWRLCELCETVNSREDRLLASMLSGWLDDDFWADMPGNLAECVRAMRAGVIPREYRWV